MNDLVNKLKNRLSQNPIFSNLIEFSDCMKYLDESTLLKIEYMEQSNGCPEIIIYDNKLIIVELSPETPNRRSICYDKEARVSRKKFPPKDSALEIANKYGLDIVNEKMYLFLQTIKKLDQKTSSWLKTNQDFRDLGGAITGEYRYNRVFIYHNGADSYYSSRSFRAFIVLKN